MPKDAVQVDGNANSFIGASVIHSVEKVKKICFLKSFLDYKPTTCASWFCGCSKLVEIEGLQYLNTENVTDMSKMFSGCTTFPSIDLSHLNTSNVTNMMWMFYGCARFTSLDVSSFDTKNVTSMASMFDGCKRFTVLDLGNFNTASVTSMTEMFYICNKMEAIFVGDYWDVSSVTLSEDMFFQCDELYGGQGTQCKGGDAIYAHVDGGRSNPGYLTKSGEKPFDVAARFPKFLLTATTCKFGRMKIQSICRTLVGKLISSMQWPPCEDYSGDFRSYGNPDVNCGRLYY